MNNRVLLNIALSAECASYFTLWDGGSLFCNSVSKDSGSLVVPEVEYPVSDCAKPRSKFIDAISEMVYMWLFEFVPKFSQHVNNFLAFFSVFFWQARKPFLNWDSPTSFAIKNDACWFPLHLCHVDNLPSFPNLCYPRRCCPNLQSTSTRKFVFL